MIQLSIRHLLLLTATAFLLRCAAPDIASDRAALVALRSTVGGRVLLWNLSSPTPCVWSGVNCSPDNSSVVELHVVELHFPGMGLSGELPPKTFSNMTNLQTLSLRYNAFSEPLPPDLFTSLTSLRNLYLQHNFFTGQVLETLFSLHSRIAAMAANRGERKTMATDVK